MRRPLPLALVGGAVSAVLVVLWLVDLRGVTTSGPAYVRTFDHNRAPLDVALAGGDGQAFAAIARDPALSRPGVFRGGAAEAAYRAQRPLASYAAWALSLGRPELVPLALAVLFVAGQALVVGTGAALLQRRGGRPEVALLLLALPPSMAALRWLGPEPLGMGLAMGGVLAWHARRRGATALAVGLFCLAGLTRETYLLVPAGLGLVSLARRDRPLPAVAALGVPALAWLAWVTVVRQRFGHWPWGASGCRLADRPLEGLLAGRAHWPESSLVTVALVVCLAAVTGACLVRRRGDELTVVVAAYAALGVFLGDCVWRRWEDFTRPLLPLFALGLVVLCSPGGSSDVVPAAAVTRRAGPRPGDASRGAAPPDR